MKTFIVNMPHSNWIGRLWFFLSNMPRVKRDCRPDVESHGVAAIFGKFYMSFSWYRPSSDRPRGGHRFHFEWLP